MPTLFQSLQSQDLGLLHIVAELWGFDLQAPDERQGRRNLADALLNHKDLLAELVEALPEEAQAAFSDLLGQSGKLPWHQFLQQYGPFREMGPGRRDREMPYLEPVSSLERLWYRALIARAFFDTPEGPQEFAYIPEDLIPLLPGFLQPTPQLVPLSRPATPAERAATQPATDRILDDLATLLAALRVGIDPEEWESFTSGWPYPTASLIALLKSAGLLDNDQTPLADPTRSFLEARRGQALAQLAQAWLHSQDYDDLRLIPHLQAEGEWLNQPMQARNAALALLQTLAADTWWSLPALFSSVMSHKPDFLRPGGDYHSWYLKDRQTGEYLRGFERWQEVEGAYLRYLISGPMHWLGMIDLGAPSPDDAPQVFRFSAWFSALREGQAPANLPEEAEAPSLDSQGHLRVPRLSPRAVRYQLTRFCEWGAAKQHEYEYRITSRSLARADAQGLQIKHLLALLQRYCTAPLPPNVIKALEHWQQHGSQVTLQEMVVLRVSHPKIIAALQTSPAKRFLGLPLGPAAIAVKTGGLKKVMDALMRLGYLSDVAVDPEPPHPPIQK